MSELKDNIKCEACGSNETSQSYEKIEQYEKKVIVTHCERCGLSFYREPIEA